MLQSILVAGCQDETQLAICELLDRAGLSVHVSTKVENAVAAFNLAPSLIIVDLSMDQGNGLDVISIARAYRLQTRIIAIASAGDTPSYDWIGTYRPDAVFGKPFDFEDFTSWLARFDLYRSRATFPTFYDQADYALESA